MIKVCEICGNEGDLKRLLYCANCNSSFQHSYCMYKVPKADKLFTWTCEECVPKLDSLPSRRSKRITLCAEVKSNRMKKLMGASAPLKMQKQSSIVKVDKQDYPSRTSLDECSETPDHLQVESKERSLLTVKDSSAEEINEYPSKEIFDDKSQPVKVDKQDYPSRTSLDECSETPEHLQVESKERSLLTVKDSSSEEINEYPSKEIFDDKSQPLQPETGSRTVSPGDGPKMTFRPQYENYNNVKPLSTPIWRGELRIINVINFGATAHLSSKASSRVRVTAASFRPWLRLELVSKTEIWPRSFQISPPTCDNIGLYFFPEYGRDEKDCQCVLNHMMEKNLAIKVSVNDVELLIFSSCELPSDHWRICGRYYLWGVFRQKSISNSRLP